VSIAENIASIYERIERAARRARRDEREITLMAVTKTVAPERIREAYAAGIRVFGENRVQEFAAKSETLKDLKGADWHLIGHLQSNKAAAAGELFNAIDSVDSLKVVQKLNAAATKRGKRLPVLIEINIAGEANKSGFAPGSAQLDDLLGSAPDLPYLEIRGLMAVPPFGENPESARTYFRKMRELRDSIRARAFTAMKMNVLSMGMSHDFEVAIEEGSTCVRIGSAIFGERPGPKIISAADHFRKKK
jgi:pyridoxal phosphate enzyme (YggS family)